MFTTVQRSVLRVLHTCLFKFLSQTLEEPSILCFPDKKAEAQMKRKRIPGRAGGENPADSKAQAQKPEAGWRVQV